MEKMVLIDGNSLAYRSYFATAVTKAGIMKNKKGHPINILLTMSKMVDKIVKEHNPSKVLIAFDAGKMVLRHQELENYKAGRATTPPELIVQLKPLKDLLTLQGYTTYEKPLYEADDIIGTLAVQAASEGYDVHCFSSDKDLFQLVRENITVQWIKNKGITETITTTSFREKYDGLDPIQLIDLKGLQGDASDNLKGITGIGEKTGINLLKRFGSLENIISNLHELTPAQQAKFEKDKEHGILCKKIATIMLNAPLDISINDLNITPVNVNTLRNFYESWGLKSLLKTLPEATVQDLVEQQALI